MSSNFARRGLVSHAIDADRSGPDCNLRPGSGFQETAAGPICDPCSRGDCDHCANWASLESRGGRVCHCPGPPAPRLVA